MNLSEIKTAIQSIVDDSYWDTQLASMVNDAILKVATGDTLPGRYELSPPLPDLYTTDTVDTVVGVGIADLPSDFNRDLFQVVNSDDENIPIEPSFKKFLKQHVELDAGEEGDA